MAALNFLVSGQNSNTNKITQTADIKLVFIYLSYLDLNLTKFRKY